jgi:hypothetical protein
MDKKTLNQIVSVFLADHLAEMEKMVLEAVTKILQKNQKELLALIKERAIPGPAGPKPKAGIDFQLPKDSIIPGPAGPKPKAGVDYPIPQDGYTPKLGVDFFIPNPIPGSPDTPEQIKQKLCDLPIKEEWFKAEHILGLRTILRAFIQNLQPMKLGGGGGGSIEFFTITGTVNSVNTAFTLPRPYTNPVICFNGQTLDPAAHYTISGTSLTLLTAPNAGTLFGFGQPA